MPKKHLLLILSIILGSCSGYRIKTKPVITADGKQVKRLTKTECQLVNEKIKSLGSLNDFAPDDILSLGRFTQPTLSPSGNLNIVFEPNKKLSPDESNRVYRYLAGQLSDGWGEGLEQIDFKMENRILNIDPLNTENDLKTRLR